MTSLPRFIVLEVAHRGWLKYVNDNQVICETDGAGVFDPLCKIEVERAKKTDDDYFHLRFCQSNKYWARGADGWLVANSTKPEEDTSKPSCTLFKILYGSMFRHVPTDGYLKIDESKDARVKVNDPAANDKFDTVLVGVKNWESFVKLPVHVAFKGDTGKYLQIIDFSGHNYLQFSSDEPHEDKSVFEIDYRPDGRVRIKSVAVNKFWRHDSANHFEDSNDHWVVAHSTGFVDQETSTHFMPVKIDETTIALRSERGDRFCKRLTAANRESCLSASLLTITKEARLTVEELVLSRKVYNVRYRMQDARIYDEKPIIAGKTTAINNGDKEASIGVEIAYSESKSYLFSNSMSITAGVSINFEGSVLGISKTGIEFSLSLSAAREWGETTTTTTLATGKGSVPVPARSSAVVSYVGTVGSCDVPFSYTREDKSSVDGRITKTEETDGIFKGVNSYNFQFTFDEVNTF